MADNKLIGQNYTTPDLVAKVTGKAKYAEDYRVEGMLFAKLLVSPHPHARVKHLDTSAAMAIPELSFCPDLLNIFRTYFAKHLAPGDSAEPKALSER